MTGGHGAFLAWIERATWTQAAGGQKILDTTDAHGYRLTFWRLSTPEGAASGLASTAAKDEPWFRVGLFALDGTLLARANVQPLP